MVRVWRDKGVARRLIAVRDNEIAAAGRAFPWCAPSCWPSALSGFMAGYAGVCLAFATERCQHRHTFDPTISILVVSMVVIGGLDSIPGALLGALYLDGLPAIFGSNPTVQFLTSGLGSSPSSSTCPAGWPRSSTALGDLVTGGIRAAQAGWPTHRAAGPPVASTGNVGEMAATLVADGPSSDTGAAAQAERRRARPARHPGVVVAFGGLRAVDGVT